MKMPAPVRVILTDAEEQTLSQLRLKAHKIAGRMFDNEHDLALAVMDGTTTRSQKGEYTLERFEFNPA